MRGYLPSPDGVRNDVSGAESRFIPFRNHPKRRSMMILNIFLRLKVRMSIVASYWDVANNNNLIRLAVIMAIHT